MNADQSSITTDRLFRWSPSCTLPDTCHTPPPHNHPCKLAPVHRPSLPIFKQLFLYPPGRQREAYVSVPINHKTIPSVYKCGLRPARARLPHRPHCASARHRLFPSPRAAVCLYDFHLNGWQHTVPYLYSNICT